MTEVTKTAPPVDLGSGADPILKDRFCILRRSPLPAFDTASAQAFSAKDGTADDLPCFALVCSSLIIPRVGILNALMTLEGAGLLRLLDHGLIPWPDSANRRYVLIYQLPVGKRALEDMGRVRPPMGEELAVRTILRPLAGVLKALKSVNIVHGGVRPTNIFMGEGRNAMAVLGECASAPTGFQQPILFETIDRALAQPDGRGQGSTSDDIYALGVTLATFLLGRSPMPDATDADILQAKIERTTYNALVGNNRIPTALMEPLRGMMSDEAKLRWTVADIDLWIAGQRMSPRQAPARKRATRPITIDDVDFRDPKLLAIALSKNTIAASRVIDNGELDRWLRRSLGDEARADLMVSTIHGPTSGGRSGILDEKTIARVCIALDPTGPLRLRSQSVRADGMGAALAHLMASGDSGQTIADMITGFLPTFQAQCLPEQKNEYMPMSQTMDWVRNFLGKTNHGSGIERVLYEINRDMPCISPLIKGYFALSARDVVLAIDEALLSHPTADPLDRHIAAFMVARHHAIDENTLSLYANAEDETTRTRMAVGIMAKMQHRFAHCPLPGVGGWVVGRVEPVIAVFRNRKVQERLRELLLHMGKAGNIEAIDAAINDLESLRVDREGFAAARQAYHVIEREIQFRTREASEKSYEALMIGRMVAAIFSSIIGTLMLVIAVFVYFVG